MDLVAIKGSKYPLFNAINNSYTRCSVLKAHFLHKDVQAIANISYRSLLIHRRPHCEFTNCGAISKMACTNSSTVLFQHSRVILYSSFSRARQSSHTCFFMRYDPIFPFAGGIS